MKTIIEDQAGFCFGVVRAINSLEEELKKGELYCIGDIVHNSMEVDRLERKGLKTISLQDFEELRDCKVMIRAHGEPPSTYEIAKKNNITLIDATCPMVLRLQKDVCEGYKEMRRCGGQIVIFGKLNHPEVIGLCGQTDNTAIVISKKEDIDKIDMRKPVHIFSQTTKNKEDYLAIIDLIRKHHQTQDIIVTDSICKKVSSRAKKIEQFAKSVDCVLFVSGKDSSNGLYLYNLCKRENENTFFITNEGDIDLKVIGEFSSIGISGATSTPMWLMKRIEEYIHKALD